MKTLIVGANSFTATKLIEVLKFDYLIGLFNNKSNRIDFQRYKSTYNSLKELHNDEKYFDTIYLIGAFIPYGNFNTPNKQFVTSNIELVAQLSTLYPESKIIFFSSISVYGNSIKNRINEYSAFDNPNLYGLSKIAGESIVKNHNRYAILRISSIWGIGVEENTFIPRLIKQAKEKGIITIYGKGDRKQNYIHYDDLIKIAQRANNLTENGVFLAVAEKSVSNLKIAEMVASKTNSTIEFVGVDTSPSLTVDASESYKKLQYKPQKDILKNIDELL